jgi:hypothetical protein
MGDPSGGTYICPAAGCGRRVVVQRAAVEEFISPTRGEKPRFVIVHCTEPGDRLITVKGAAITDRNRQESHRKQF